MIEKMIDFRVQTVSLEKQKTDCWIVGVYAPNHLSPMGKKIDALSQGLLSHLLKKREMEGQVGQLLLIPHIPALPDTRILLVGFGNENTLSPFRFTEIISKTIMLLGETATQEAISFLTEMAVPDRDLAWHISQTVRIMEATLYRFEALKSIKNPKRSSLLRHFTFHVPQKRTLPMAQQALQQGLSVANGIRITKDLAHLPANLCTPTYLAEQAKVLAKNHGKGKLSVAILEEKQIASLGMGLLLSVTRGSTTPAKLITLSYRGTPKDVKPIVLIGKGITFDTGGNSLKPALAMIGMKYDMCGAATVFGVLEAAVELDLPLNLIGLVPTCENMPGPNATRPDDVVTSLSGLTVEILNTDAEGRLILADALTYAERFEPEIVIDIATLTGACMIALGPYASALMSNHEPLSQALIAAGEKSGDRVWPLPLWEEYHEALRSEFADIANIPSIDIGARTIMGGCFLAKFAEKYHWAHLDIANTASLLNKRAATGRPVALLMQYLLDRVKKGQ